MRSIPWFVAFATVVTLATYCAGADESSAPQSLTLQQCIDLALKQNTDILKAQQEIRRTHGVIVEARAAALPQLTASGQYERVDKNVIDLFRLGATNAPSPCSPTGRFIARMRRFPWSGLSRWRFLSRPVPPPFLFPPMSGCFPAGVLPSSCSSPVSLSAGFKNERVVVAVQCRGRLPCLTMTRTGNPKTLANLSLIYECNESLFAIDSDGAGCGGRPGGLGPNQ